MSFPTEHLRTLTGHNGPVNIATFSAGSGQYVLTGCSDRLIRLFNVSSGNLVQTYDAHGHAVLDIASAADNARFASVGGDRSVFLWDVASVRTLRRWGGHWGRVEAVRWGGDGNGEVIVSGGFDATVRIWDCRTTSPKPIQVFEDAGDGVDCLDVRGHEICAGSVDGKVRLYDLRMGMIYVDVIGRERSLHLALAISLNKFRNDNNIADVCVAVEPDSVTSVRQTKDGNALLISSLDNTIRLLDKGNGNLLQSYKGHKNTEYRIRSCLGMNDRFVLSGSEDGKLWTWDLLEGTVVAKLEAHVGKAASAVEMQDLRKEWLSAGTDGEIRRLTLHANIWLTS
ncbi:MAG: hypothetical protein M1825_005797 [Sarcosagium campestre]|nr:MAG: hypothetical protein M1825_005797 [Sarcosagium campestre]